MYKQIRPFATPTTTPKSPPTRPKHAPRQPKTTPRQNKATSVCTVGRFFKQLKSNEEFLGFYSVMDFGQPENSTDQSDGNQSSHLADLKGKTWRMGSNAKSLYKYWDSHQKRHLNVTDPLTKCSGLPSSLILLRRSAHLLTSLPTSPVMCILL